MGINFETSQHFTWEFLACMRDWKCCCSSQEKNRAQNELLYLDLCNKKDFKSESESSKILLSTLLLMHFCKILGQKKSLARKNFNAHSCLESIFFFGFGIKGTLLGKGSSKCKKCQAFWHTYPRKKGMIVFIIGSLCQKWRL